MTKLFYNKHKFEFRKMTLVNSCSNFNSHKKAKCNQTKKRKNNNNNNLMQ